MAYYYYRSYRRYLSFFGTATDPSDIGPSVIRVFKDFKVLISCYSFYAGLALVVGIIFLATCKKQPVKWFEYTLLVVILLFQPIVSRGLIDRGPLVFDGKLFVFTSIIQFCCYLLGAPGKKGFKDFPFKSKDDAHSEKSIDKLTKIKELLDSGAITQEEFDQEKKKIWK